jgi:glycosyltransferase involved in cell wall biosynthesis
MPKKILFLIPYPVHESPSQRFRFEQYFNILQHHGYRYSVQSFLNDSNWKAFYIKGNTFNKGWALVSGFAKRVIVLYKSLMYDFVFIHREVAPLGPPVFEWILAKVLRRKIVYDFDDAIWLTDRENESLLLRTAKYRGKVRQICRWSYKVSCGNEYLCSYAAEYANNVICNPTTIDTENLHNRALFPTATTPKLGKLRIGWTGSHSTLKYLERIEPILKKKFSEYPELEFVVIADQKPTLPSLPSVLFIPWNRKTEIEDLMSLDIGIMPLPDDKWANGKCGFKALQYMALEIPAVASPVGVNSKIINHGVDGLLCNTSQEWEEALTNLIEKPDLRKSMGDNGRRKIIENYSVRSNTSTFLSLFV